MKQATSMRHRQAGVTLLELMIVVAVVGILAAIAYPSYQTQVQRTNRAEAKIALEQAAASLEKCYTRYLSYDDPNCAVRSSAITTAGITTPKLLYKVTGAFTVTSYTLTATAQNAQSKDGLCGNFTLTERGTRGVTGTQSSTPLQCWGR